MTRHVDRIGVRAAASERHCYVRYWRAGDEEKLAAALERLAEVIEDRKGPGR